MFAHILTTMLTTKGDVLLIKEIHKMLPHLFANSIVDIKSLKEFNSEINDKMLVCCWYYANWGSSSLKPKRDEKNNCVKLHQMINELNATYTDVKFIKVESALCDATIEDIPFFSKIIVEEKSKFYSFPQFKFYRYGRDISRNIIYKKGKFTDQDVDIFRSEIIRIIESGHYSFISSLDNKKMFIGEESKNEHEHQ